MNSTLTNIEQKNVLGLDLEPCGTQRHTGYTRTGTCVFTQTDRGAHNVCIEGMPPKFSELTGQGSWSDKYIGTPWCICVWAWIAWIGTLDQAAEVSCTGTSALVLSEAWAGSKRAGFLQGSKSKDYTTAARALCAKCREEMIDEFLLSVCDEFNGETNEPILLTDETKDAYYHDEL